jgi:hypothetical protein
MKLWTMLAGLLVAGVMASGAYAQGEGKKRGEGKRGPRQMASFKDMVGSDDGKLTEELFVKARTKNAPEEKKEQATTRAKEMWKRLAGDKTELTKAEYDAAVEKFREKMKEKFKGGKGRKGKGGPKEEKKEG